MSKSFPQVLRERLEANNVTLTTSEKLSLVRLALDPSVRVDIQMFYYMGVALAWNNRTLPFGTILAPLALHFKKYEGDETADDTMITFLVMIRVLEKCGIITQRNDKTGRLLFDKTCWSEEQEAKRIAGNCGFFHEDNETYLDGEFINNPTLRKTYDIVFSDGPANLSDVTPRRE